MLFTSSILSTDNEKSPAKFDFVSAIGLVAKVVNFSWVIIITKMFSLQTIHFAVASENWGLFAKPNAV